MMNQVCYNKKQCYHTHHQTQTARGLLLSVVAHLSGRGLFSQRATIMERWVVIEDGRYAVSDHGRVKRLISGQCRAERILRPSTGKLGYPRVMLYRDGKQVTMLIHHAVALHFIGMRPVGLVVDHIDGTRDNNHYSNLRYITHSENIRKGYDGKRGQNNPSAKYSDNVVDQIRNRRLAGERGCDLAREFGVSQQTVCDIVKGRSRKEAANVVA